MMTVSVGDFNSYVILRQVIRRDTSAAIELTKNNAGDLRLGSRAFECGDLLLNEIGHNEPVQLPWRDDHRAAGE